MLDKVKKYNRSGDNRFEYSLIIPSWNNLEYLQLCLRSIQENSSLNLQIIVFVNQGEDGTLEWVQNETNFDYLHSNENIGICYGLNLCRSLVKSDYILYLNDDMYVLPNWDVELDQQVKKEKDLNFMLSATMIEPNDTGNPCVIVKDYGDDIVTFKEEQLKKDFKSFPKEDWSGSTWPPNVMHVDLWDLVGGLSGEFSPGMYSDPDFSKKLYDAGIRRFKGVASSRVYHFGSKSTGRIKKNKGRTQFMQKWGFTSGYFTKTYLNIGKPYKQLPNAFSESASNRFKNKIKLFKELL